MKHLLTSFLISCLLAPGMQAQTVITDTLMSLKEHSLDITQAVYSLDGRRLVSGSLDRTVNVYESINWIPMASYSHYDQVTHVAISRDNSIVASISKDNNIKVWSLDTAKLMFECTGHEGTPTGLAIDMGIRFLYTSSDDGFIRIYDLRKGGKQSRKFSAGIAITSLALSHNGFIYAGLRNGDIKIYNYMGKEVKTIQAHKGEVSALYYAFYKNLSYIVSGSEDQTIKVFDAKSFKELRTFTGHTWKINCVEMSRDLKYVLSASNDGTAKIWDLVSGEQLVSFEKMGEAVRTISINGDNTNVATTAIVRSDTPEYAVYIWDPKLIKEVKVETQPAKVLPEKKEKAKAMSRLKEPYFAGGIMENLINSDKAPEPVGLYPHARKVGNLLFLSGVGPRQRGTKKIPGVELDENGNIQSYDIEAQCHSVFNNVKNILEASGSSWDKIVDVTVYLTNMKDDFPVYNRLWAVYFKDNLPCRTTMEINCLPTPIAIELKVIATVD